MHTETADHLYLSLQDRTKRNNAGVWWGDDNHNDNSNDGITMSVSYLVVGISDSGRCFDEG